MTGIETASMMPWIMSGSLMRATPPCARMSAGTRSSAMTATAPASSAILACSGVTTSMITPPFSISAIPRFTRAVPCCWPALGVSGNVLVGRHGDTPHSCDGDTRSYVSAGAGSAISKYAGIGAVPASRSHRTRRWERSPRVSRTASLCTRRARTRSCSASTRAARTSAGRAARSRRARAGRARWPRPRDLRGRPERRGPTPCASQASGGGVPRAVRRRSRARRHGGRRPRAHRPATRAPPR